MTVPLHLIPKVVQTIEMGGSGARSVRTLTSSRQSVPQRWALVFMPLLIITSASADATTVSNVGRIFSFLVPAVDINWDNGPVIFVTAPSSPDDERAIYVRVAVPDAEFDTSVYVSPGTTGVVPLPPTATGGATGPQRGTVSVEASSPVAVQVMVTGRSSSEAFLALPFELLGMEYIASSTSPNNHDAPSQSALTITGVCDGTSISIKFKASGSISYGGVDYKAGRTLRVTLDTGKSIQIQSDDVMTGARITSDKPIAVLLANTCPADGEHCDYMVEQLSPVYALGKQFLLAHLDVNSESNAGDEVLVLATRSGTTVEISSMGLRRRLGRGEQWQLPRNQIGMPLFLVADKPVQVTLYSLGVSVSGCSPEEQGCDGRSNTMMIIPPVEQFKDRSDFVVWNTSVISPDSDQQPFKNVLTILSTGACDYVASELMLTSDQSENITWTKEGVSGKPDACVLRAEVTPGTFHLSAQFSASDMRFAVLLYAVNSHRTYSIPVTTGGNHLGYISRETQRHECTVESFDPCVVNPCRNGGDCIRDGDGYRCSCITPFYEGPLCQTRVDPCSLGVTLCFNGGTCDPDRSPLCLCPRDWGGKHCEYDVKSKTTSANSKEFVFTFMEHPTPRRSPSIFVATGANSINTTIVNVHIPAVGFTKTLSISPNQVEVVELPEEAISLGSRKQNSGVSVSASQDITVTGFHNSLAPGDGFLALPVNSLGTLHHVVTARQRKKRPAEKSQIAIVAAADNTTIFIRTHVSVTFQGHAYAGYSTIISNLERLEVVQLQSRFDLSRTEISSDNPVAVLSGSTCGYTMYEGTDRKSCSFMVEQLLPMHSWGKRFVVSPFLGNTNGETTLRIIGGPKGTIVRDGHARQAFLYDGSMHEMYITQPRYITATGPVMVVAFSVQATSDCSSKAGECQVVSVPTMSVLPALNHTTTSATFTTPSAVNTHSLRYKNYINIITSDCSGIRLLSLSPRREDQSVWDTTANVRFTGLCVIGKEIPPGVYQVSSKSGNVTFSAQQYGFNNYGSAYGFPTTPSGHLDEDIAEIKVGTSGKEFVLTFTSGGNYFPKEGPRLLITAATNATKTEVKVSGADLKVNLTLEPNEVKVVDIPPTLIAISAYNPYPDIAIHVRSSHDVTVYGMNDAFGTDEGYETVSDGYHALPVPALGREYSLVTSWPAYQHYPERTMQFVIIGIHDGTRVDIELNGSVWFDNYIYYGGSSMTIILNKLQVAYFKAKEEHTGTHVLSSKPIAVISGSDCGFAHRYPNDGPADYPCDHQVEFMTPVMRWGSTFLLASLQGYRGGDIYIRVQAIHDFTTVRFGSGAKTAEYNMQEFSSPLSFNIGVQGFANHTLLESNLPVSVSAFTIYQPLLNCPSENSSCEGYSRPVLFTVPPVESFKKRLIFPSYRVRGADDMACYADIYTKCSEAAFVLVNGESQSWEYPLEEIDMTGYCVLRLQLAADEIATSYVVQSSLENGRLGAITYGFSKRSGYAFPGGI